MASEELESTVTKDESKASVVWFTCTATAYTPSSGSVSFSWTKNGASFSPEGATVTTTATTTKFSVSKTAGSSSGEYKCVVTYGNLGDVTSDGVELKIDEAVVPSANLYTFAATNVLTCIVYGTEPTAVTWSDGMKHEPTESGNTGQ